MLFRSWAPWRAYAAIHLWHRYEQIKDGVLAADAGIDSKDSNDTQDSEEQAA